MSWQQHDDAMSRAVVQAFRDALDPLITEIAKGWRLHHIKMLRENFNHDEVEIRIVIRPDPRYLEGPR